MKKGEKVLLVLGALLIAAALGWNLVGDALNVRMLGRGSL